MKCKAFSNGKLADIEVEVNKWLSENDKITIHHVKFSTDSGASWKFVLIFNTNT